MQTTCTRGPSEGCRDRGHGVAAAGLRALGLAAAICGVALCAAPVAARAEGCPNEQLRVENGSTALPDCRAYELVTPPHENGQAPLIGFPTVSADGSSLIFDDLGAFGEAGDDDQAVGAEYLASRGGSGWSSQPGETSASQFQDYELIGGTGASDAGQDLGETLLLRAPVSAKSIDARFYLRQPGAATAEASLTEVGPTLPPARVAALTQSESAEGTRPHVRYVGASPDLGHVLFATEVTNGVGREGFLWPGDTTVAYSSLYEYSGTGNAEPRLVGVENAGPLDGSPHVNEGAELISQCGIVLGGANAENRSLDTYNAIADGGAKVFFTAGRGGCPGGVTDGGEPVAVGSGPAVNELYARVDGAETVAISEPTTSGPDASCERCNESEPREAIFQGASEDGSKVFFLSAQQLLPGAKGIDLYEYDFDAADPHERVSLIAPEMAEVETEEGGRIVREPGGVMRVAEDGSRVYFAATGLLTKTPNLDGEYPVEGAPNLYVYDTDTRRFGFVATLSGKPGSVEGEATGLPGFDGEDWRVEDHRPVEATPDGRYLLFASTNDLTPGTSGELEQFYRYDAESGELVRVTIGENGFDDNGEGDGVSLARIVSLAYTNVDYAAPQPDSITDDGSQVFFTSASALTPGALEDACAVEYAPGAGCAGTPRWLALNVYEYEHGHVYLISDGRDRSGLYKQSAVRLLGANPSGSDVFLTTADSLVPEDTDTQVDIYDAHVDGGFPVEPVSCTSSCQGATAGPPVFGAPASATLTGVPSAAPAPPATAVKSKAKAKPKACRRGFVKQRGKCLERPKQRAKRSKRSSGRTK